MPFSSTSRALIAALLCVLIGACAHRPNVPIAAAALAAAGEAAAPGFVCLADWQPMALPGKRATRYAYWPIGPGGGPALRAEADASASLLNHRVERAPQALGRLRFDWQVQRPGAPSDVRYRDLEDAPARIVLAFAGDHAGLSARNQLIFDLAELVSGERPPYATLMYVWNGAGPVDSVVVNPRTDRVRKIVVDAGSERLRQWRSHERDIAADFRRAFGEEPGGLIGVGLMTDADNTGGAALSWYGPVCLGPATAGPAVVRP